MDIINGRIPIPPFITFFIFSLAIANAAASIHSANTRGRLAASIQVDQDATNLIPSSFTLPPTTITRHHQLAAAAIMETDIIVRKENNDQGRERPQPLTIPAASTGASKPCTLLTTKTGAITTFKANWVPLPTGIPASPPPPTPTTTTPSFNPQASCMLAIFSLISNIPTPGPALSTALEKAKHALAPSAMAAPQCTITLPASLSSEYGVYTSRVDSWVSVHSQELDKLESVCGEGETGRMSVYKRERIRATGGEMGRSVTDVVHGTTMEQEKGTGTGTGCTAPVAVFTGATGKNTTAKATSTKSGTGVVSSTKTGTVTTTTVTTSSTSSVTGSATTVAGATSSQPAEGSKVGGAARATGVMAVAMVVAGFLAFVIVM